MCYNGSNTNAMCLLEVSVWHAYADVCCIGVTLYGPMSRQPLFRLYKRPPLLSLNLALVTSLPLIASSFSLLALSRAASALLGNNHDGPALVSWLESLQQEKLLRHACLSNLDSMVTAEEVASNVEMLLAIEEDTDAADRLFSGSGVRTVAELAIG